MKTTFKVLLASAAILASQTALQADDTKHFNGFYTGGDIGLTDGGEFYYGTHIGVRTQTENNWVFGAEGTFGDYAVKERVGQVEVSIDYAWSVGGYVGKAFGADGRNLIKVGGAYNNIHAEATTTGTSASETFDDFRGFVGYERAIGNSLSFRLQADYLKLESSDGAQFTTGLSYRF